MDQTEGKQEYQPPTLEQHTWIALTGTNFSVGVTFPSNPLEMNSEGLSWGN